MCYAFLNRFYSAVVNMVNLEKEESAIKDFEMDAEETCPINVSFPAIGQTCPLEISWNQTWICQYNRIAEVSFYLAVREATISMKMSSISSCVPYSLSKNVVFQFAI